MKPTHVKNYMLAMGFTDGDFIPCEVCGKKSADIHHIIPRSAFGSTMKEEQDNAKNLIALCRLHHDEAHGPLSRHLKGVYKILVNKRVTN